VKLHPLLDAPSPQRGDDLLASKGTELSTLLFLRLTNTTSKEQHHEQTQIPSMGALEQPPRTIECLPSLVRENLQMEVAF